eukprot:3641357-Rhodomonas_salina.1
MYRIASEAETRPVQNCAGIEKAREIILRHAMQHDTPQAPTSKELQRRQDAQDLWKALKSRFNHACNLVPSQATTSLSSEEPLDVLEEVHAFWEADEQAKSMQMVYFLQDQCEFPAQKAVKLYDYLS